MGFSKAVQWWEEWQLRVLVLASLFLQYFLMVAAALRKHRIPAWFRFLTWLAYLGSDATAIYALATLFNRHTRQEWVSRHHSSIALEALWAPILLMHLGGQIGITAYNIEDNELWRRHVLTALSQIAVAMYVFRKSWSGGDKRLLQAAILTFIPGTLKCLEKPWALNRASINSIVNRTDSTTHKDDQINSFEKYMETAAEYFQKDSQESTEEKKEQKDSQESTEEEKEQKPYNLFVDIAPTYSDRINRLKYVVQNKDKVHDLLRSGLSRSFDRLYTREQVRTNMCSSECTCNQRRCCGHMMRHVVLYLTFAAIGLFHNSHRESYNNIDVKVTYILLCCTAAQEFITSQLWTCFGCCGSIFGRPWPEQVSQYNLIWYLARNKSHRVVRNLAGMSFLKHYVDKLWCMKPCGSKSSRDITMVIHEYVVRGWTDHMKDTPSFRAFNDNRGQWTLKRENCSRDLEWSLRRPFDECVLLWHLATDFYFYNTAPPPSLDIVGRCRVISNYMTYLLFVNPEMLMAGARRSLFRATYSELKKIIDDSPSLDVKDLCNKITKKVKAPQSSSVACDALTLYEKLRLGGEEKMWRVIEGVWVEMLCFSASRCRGYLHAKSLGSGGEYLSYVWLLLSYMGMETMSERMQRTVLEEDGANLAVEMV
ncbi:hypothetical protein EJB05_27387, partial [Eragrostis curvula]